MSLGTGHEASMAFRHGQPLVEHIAGYDAREYRDDFAMQWPGSRRAQYLYRLDVRKVLSVDVRVWPTLFTAMAKAPPPYQAAMQSLWADRGELRRAVSAAVVQPDAPPSRTVVVTAFSGGSEHDHPVLDDVASLVDPAEVAPQWRLLGYDVADAWNLSALSNCGFLPPHDNVLQMRRLWGPHLNEFHLFTELDIAIEFRKMSDLRLASDHAPTFVYGIRLVT